MQLTIYCTDNTKQRIQLDSSFATDSTNRGQKRIMTKDQIEKKAMITAISIVNNLYNYHIIDDVDDEIRDLRELTA